MESNNNATVSLKKLGKVKWWNADKGYGFIKPLGKGKEIFLHWSELKKIGLNDKPREEIERLTLRFKVALDDTNTNRKRAVELELVEVEATPESISEISTPITPSD